MSKVTYTPNSKVTDGALAGAIIAVSIWLLRDYAGIVVPGTAASGLTVIATLLVSYWLPERRNPNGTQRNG